MRCLIPKYWLFCYMWIGLFGMLDGCPSLVRLPCIFSLWPMAKHCRRCLSLPTVIVDAIAAAAVVSNGFIFITQKFPSSSQWIGPARILLLPTYVCTVIDSSTPLPRREPAKQCRNFDSSLAAVTRTMCVPGWELGLSLLLLLLSSSWSWSSSSLLSFALTRVDLALCRAHFKSYLFVVSCDASMLTLRTFHNLSNLWTLRT